jgi:hypothetical protein
VNRIYCYIFSAVVLFGSIGIALLKESGALSFSFFMVSLPSQRMYLAAITYCIVFTLALFAFRRFFGLRQFTATTNNSPIRLPTNVATGILAAACMFALVYIWLDSDLLTAQVTFRHSGSEILRRISLLVFLTGIVAASTRPSIGNVVPLLLLLFAATLYPAADAGRSVAIPFIVAAATMFFNRYRFLASVMIVAALIALAAAFEARGLPSYANFWASVFDIVGSLDIGRVFRPILQNSFPGLDTMSVFEARASIGSDLSFYRILEFIAYYSPAPSGLFPPRYFEQTSLNGVLGISMDVVGLNSDIYSEPLFWFGYAGMVIVPVLLAGMTCLSFVATRSLFGQVSQRSQLVALLPVIWMLVGGMVFSLRAGSRFVWAILFLALLVRIIRIIHGARTGSANRKATV